MADDDFSPIEVFASLHEYRDCCFRTDRQYFDDRNVYLNYLVTFPRFSAPARALLLVVFAVAAGALAIAMNLGSFIWSCAVATVLAAISAAAYAISRNLARWRRLSKPQRLSIVDELFARGLISAEESDALRLRIELIFEAAGRKSIVQHDET